MSYVFTSTVDNIAELGPHRVLHALCYRGIVASVDESTRKYLVFSDGRSFVLSSEAIKLHACIISEHVHVFAFLKSGDLCVFTFEQSFVFSVATELSSVSVSHTDAGIVFSTTHGIFRLQFPITQESIPTIVSEQIVFCLDTRDSTVFFGIEGAVASAHLGPTGGIRLLQSVSLHGSSPKKLQVLDDTSVAIWTDDGCFMMLSKGKVGKKFPCPPCSVCLTSETVVYAEGAKVVLTCLTNESRVVSEISLAQRIDHLALQEGSVLAATSEGAVFAIGVRVQDALDREIAELKKRKLQQSREISDQRTKLVLTLSKSEESRIPQLRIQHDLGMRGIFMSDNSVCFESTLLGEAKSEITVTLQDERIAGKEIKVTAVSQTGQPTCGTIFIPMFLFFGKISSPEKTPEFQVRLLRNATVPDLQNWTRDHMGAKFGTSETTLYFEASDGRVIGISASTKDVQLMGTTPELLAYVVDSFDWTSTAQISVSSEIREELVKVFAVVDALHATVQRFRAEVSEKAEEFKVYVTRLEDFRLIGNFEKMRKCSVAISRCFEELRLLKVTLNANKIALQEKLRWLQTAIKTLSNLRPGRANKATVADKARDAVRRKDPRALLDVLLN